MARTAPTPAPDRIRTMETMTALRLDIDPRYAASLLNELGRDHAHVAAYLLAQFDCVEAAKREAKAALECFELADTILEGLRVSSL